VIVLESRSSGVQKGASIPIAPLTIIGRSPDSQVQLDDKLISAHHARLRLRNGRWYLEDLQSTNGTLLNQEAVDGEQAIEYGDVIGVGDVRLKLAKR
jgi:pSer/pThr/pTyr-binding forkhead associated (FHA) protein